MGGVGYFVAGIPTSARGLLATYRDPLPTGLASIYLQACTQPGQLVLDPFCQSATVLEEASALGRLAIVTHFNPALALATRLNVALPDRRALGTALIQLTTATRFRTTLAQAIEELYRTRCPHCERPAVADNFIWEQTPDESDQVQQHKLKSKTLRCGECGFTGQAEADRDDEAQAASINPRGLAYWRILDQIAPDSSDPERTAIRVRAQKLLDLYTPRNLYALSYLQLKIAALETHIGEGEYHALLGALLHALDWGCSLRRPDQETRPRQLRRPTRFVEHNVWQLFQHAIQELSAAPPSPRCLLLGHPRDLVNRSPDAPAAGVVTARSLRHLRDELPPHSIQLVFLVPPQHDPALWSLVALWSAWLFGAEASLTTWPLTEHRFADWARYQEAMRGVLRALHRLLHPQGRVVCVFRTGEAPLPEALSLAAAQAGLTIEHLLHQVQGQEHAYRLSLMPIEQPRKPIRDFSDAIAVEVVNVLRQRGEPTVESMLRAAVLHTLSRNGHLAMLLSQAPSPMLARWLRDEIVTTLEKIPGLQMAESLPIAAGRHWWLSELSGLPLCDQVELAVWELLQSALVLQAEELEATIYQQFPGLLTPDAKWVELCRASYGQEITPGYWQLRPEDDPQARRRAALEMGAHLKALGKRLGFLVWEEQAGVDSQLGETVIIWREANCPVPVYWFRVVVTAAISRLVLGAPPLAEQRCLVLPGGRAGLIHARRSRDPRWVAALSSGGWQFIKYRHLRALAARPHIDRPDLKSILGLDPIVEQAEAQIPLF